MNPGTADDPFRGALRYPDDRPVDLDVSAIMVRGTQIRRKRLLARVSAAALACAVVPVTVVLATAGLPATHGGAGVAAVPAARKAAASGAGTPSLGMGASGKTVHGGSEPGVANRGGTAAYRLAAREVPASVAASVTLPKAYHRIGNLVGDSTGTGVWFWSMRKDIDIFHLSRSGRLRSWRVLPVTARLQAGRDAGFDVTSARVAWLGLNHTLIRLDTRTGAVRSWAIPAPRANPAVRASQPPRLKGQHRVQALAVQPGGEVAIADTGDASSVQVFHPGTGKFTQVLMPSADDQPAAVGFTGNGTLVAGYEQAGNPHQSGVVIAPATGPALIRELPDSGGVAAYGADSLLAGTHRPYVVSGAGVVRPLVMPASRLPSAMTPVPLPGGRLAAIVPGGVLALPADAASAGQARAGSVLYESPATKCGIGAPRQPGATTTQAPGEAARTCHLRLESLVTDAAGDLWIMTPSGLTIARLIPR